MYVCTRAPTPLPGARESADGAVNEINQVGRSRSQARMMLMVLILPMVLMLPVVLMVLANDAHACVFFLSRYRVGINLSIVRLSRNLTI